MGSEMCIRDSQVKLVLAELPPQPVSRKANAAASTTAVMRKKRFKKETLIPFIMVQKPSNTALQRQV